MRPRRAPACEPRRIALTILTFNPVAWIVNAIYLRKRWAEDAAPAPTH